MINRLNFPLSFRLPLLGQKVVTTLKSIAQKIADVARSIFQSISFYVKRTYSSIRSLFITDPKVNLSRDPRTKNKNRVAPVVEKIDPSIYQSLTVNQNRLRDVPPPINYEAILEIEKYANPKIEIKELLTQFDRVFADFPSRDTLYEDDRGSKRTKAQGRRDLEDGFLSYIRIYAGAQDSDMAMNKQNAENMRSLLIGVIFELKKDEVPLEKKKEVLIRLARAANHCAPRKNEEMRKTYLTLSNQMDTLDKTILTYIQQTKEDLFLNHYSLSAEPVMTLNFIRKTVGPEFGLDCESLKIRELFIGIHDARSPKNRWSAHKTSEDFRKTFHEIYTPENILFLMTDKLNERIAQDPSFARDVSEFIDQTINEHVKSGDLGEKEADKLPQPYQDPKTYYLTPEGVKFLLVHFNHLSHLQKNGHLVRVP